MAANSLRGSVGLSHGLQQVAEFLAQRQVLRDPVRWPGGIRRRRGSAPGEASGRPRPRAAPALAGRRHQGRTPLLGPSHRQADPAQVHQQRAALGPELPGLQIVFRRQREILAAFGQRGQLAVGAEVVRDWPGAPRSQRSMPSASGRSMFWKAVSAVAREGWSPLSAPGRRCGAPRRSSRSHGKGKRTPERRGSPRGPAARPRRTGRGRPRSRRSSGRYRPGPCGWRADRAAFRSRFQERADRLIVGLGGKGLVGSVERIQGRIRGLAAEDNARGRQQETMAYHQMTPLGL